MSNERSRRDFLRVAGQALGAGAVLPYLPSPAWASTSDSALAPVSMAMHIHASFSEGIKSIRAASSASMERQLDQAQRSGVDVIWWTEHDTRMTAYKFRQQVHFDSLTEAENNLPWTWQPVTSGPLSSHGGGIVTSPASPKDPHPRGALSVRALSASGKPAAYGYIADTEKAGLNLRTALAGQSVLIEIYPQHIGADGYLEIKVLTSTRPAKSGRPSGMYELSYRFGGPGQPGTRQASGLTGIINVAASAGRWNSVVLRPAADISAIWPDIDGRDASFYDIVLSAVSLGSATAGCFDFLRFDRTLNDGQQSLTVQADLMAVYESAYPTVIQFQAVELTQLPNHLNWFGPRITLPDYNTLDRSGGGSALLKRQVATAHAAGGLASYNHPFGAKSNLLSTAEQERLRRSTATKLIGANCFNSDILEAGYRQRGGVNLDRHVLLWDALSRNGIFLTGTGVSDNHAGDWATQANGLVTWAWSPDKTMAALLRALSAGRIFFGDPFRFAGHLDLAVDGGCPMGSVSVSTARSRTLTITAAGVPSGGNLLLVQGVVDFAGSGQPDPRNTVTAYPAAAFAGGAKTVTVDNSAASYLRTVVVNSGGLAVAYSNPAWLLRSAPQYGIPAARAC